MKYMPTPQEILAGLEWITNHYWWLAAAWHVVFLIVIFLLFSGWRPPKKLAGMMLTLPLLSVSAFAWLSGNPFNAAVFLLLSVLLIVIWIRFPRDTSDLSGGYFFVAGVLMIIYAWIYPHFLATEHFYSYLYASPMGLIPCPTLSLVIGFTLLLEGFGSKKWVLVLSLVGLFYAIIGIVRLKVYLDVGLLIGSLLLCLTWIGMKVEERKKAKYE